MNPPHLEAPAGFDLVRSTENYSKMVAVCLPSGRLAQPASETAARRERLGADYFKLNSHLTATIHSLYEKYLFRVPSHAEIAQHLRHFASRFPLDRHAARAIRESRIGTLLGIRPLNVEMDVTNQCNIRCIMCEFSNEGFRKQARRDLSVREFARIAEQLFPLCHRVCLSFGAEPLLHRQFPELLAITEQYDVPFVYFNTNGLLLSPAVLSRLLDHQVNAVTISIDAATAKTYERIRSGGRFDRLIANIRELNRQKRERGSLLPVVNFGFVMMRSNIAELPDLVRLAAELDVSGIIGQHVLPYAITDVEHESLSHDRELCNRMCDQAEAVAVAKGVALTLPERFRDPHDARQPKALTSTNGQGSSAFVEPDWLLRSKAAARHQMLNVSEHEPWKSCYFPWHFLVIDMHGNVMPCGWWFGASPLGNIRVDDFDTIWGSARFRALRVAHQGGDLPHPCRECPVGGIGEVNNANAFRLEATNLSLNTERVTMITKEKPTDSAYQVGYHAHNLPARMPAGELRTLWITLENHGSASWSPQTVQLAIDINGSRCIEREFPNAVATGERVTIHWLFWVPDVIGRHRLTAALVEKDGPTFEEHGVQPLTIWFDAIEHPKPQTSKIRAGARSYLGSSWVPGDGVSWSSRGAGFPLFAREARGCRITDVEGRTYVDCGMGFGCALLGYAHPRIQSALSESLTSGAVLTLTHHLEYEVAAMLCDMIPSAELVVFGKNGSDVCTLAVRLARSYTRRPIILTCGYHGWQDWFAERHGFLGSGIPERENFLVFEFDFNNIESLSRLLHAHRENVAAVMLEPSNPLEGHNGPIQEVNPEFLKEVVKLAHANGSLVIFDEIITGFRYPGGSVQRATGVLPDLTCLGKSMTSGMPLSAVLGRRDVMHPTLEQCAYGPTFKSEMYSFAAAREALRIYQEVDVPGHVRAFGTKLRENVNRLARETEVPGELIGPPHLMIFAFHETNECRQELMRTLLNQELHRNGVLTYMNLFVPSLGHDDAALADLLKGFEQAFKVLREAMSDDRFASFLEIPPIHT